MQIASSTRPSFPTGRLLRLDDVQAVVGLKKSSIYMLMRQGRFPVCVRLTRRSVAWRESDIAAWVESRVSESRAAQVEGGAQ